MKNFSFKKEERLTSTKVIGRMFKEGQSFGQYPLRLVWLPQGSDSPVPLQVVVSVPKKRFKKAVDRNRIRRRVREAYRLNKGRIYQRLDGRGARFALMIIYTGQEEMSFEVIDQAMRQMLARFLKKTAETTN